MTNTSLSKKRKRNEHNEDLALLPPATKKKKIKRSAKIKIDLFVQEVSKGDLETIKRLCANAENIYALDFMAARSEATNHSCQNILDYFSEDTVIQKIFKEQQDFKSALECSDTKKLAEIISKQPKLLDSKINGTYPLFVALNKGHAPTARLIIKSLPKTTGKLVSYIEENKNSSGLNAIEDANKSNQVSYARILINTLPSANQIKYVGEGWINKIKHQYRTHNDKINEAKKSKSNTSLSLFNNASKIVQQSLPFFALGPAAGTTALAVNLSTTFVTTYGPSQLLYASEKYLPAKVSQLVDPTLKLTMIGLQAYNCYQNPIGYIGGITGAHIATEIACSLTNNPEIIGAAYFGGTQIGRQVAIELLKAERAPHISDFKSDDSMKKTTGISNGGFYFDNEGTKWMIKSPHDIESAFNEYAGGALFSILIPKYTPHETIIVTNSSSNLEEPILIGSKILNGFQSLDKVNIIEKDLEGILEVMASCIFLGEADLNLGNLGVINSKSFAKIDHGYTFFRYNYSHLNLTHENIYDMIGSYRYMPVNVDDYGFDKVYDVISKISNLSLTQLESIIKNKYQNFQNTLSNVNRVQELNLGPEMIVENLKNNHKAFNVLKTYMSFEKAVVSHDTYSINKMFNSGLDPKGIFTPFFDKMKRITPAQLLNEKYPEYTHSALAAL